MPGASTEYPLSGIRVLDFSRLIPGAFATLMLAELGADVIKIEDPRGGDPMRSLPPLVDGRGIYHLLLDRGKKSVTMDLRDPASRPIVDRLIAQSDVVVESFRPAAAKRLGISGAEIHSRHPQVVHCAITGYGQTGPYAEVPGHDLNYVALSGLLSVDRPDPASLPRMFIADVGGGAFSAVVGILAALVGRGRTGRGASLDISMHESMLYWVMVAAAREFVDGGRTATDELPTFGGHACYNVYRTKDGHLLALGALESKFWRRFCEIVGRPDFVDRQLTDAGDQARLLEDVRGLVASRTRDAWLEMFRGEDVCLTPVNSPADAVQDAHVRARSVLQMVPGGRAIRPPFVETSPALSPAPGLGVDTEDVLRHVR